MPAEIDPHADYLNTVFARIDRLRQIDVSVLTERYGVDPAALTPALPTHSSGLVARFLSEAAAQREEIHQHLKGLTQEYVAEGLAFDIAARKAQEAVGDPVMLAKQLTRSTAQSALMLQTQWFPWLRSIKPSLYGLPLLCAVFTSFGDFSALQVLASVGAVSVAIGLTQGYAVGFTITPELSKTFGETAYNLQTLLKLPTMPSISLRQRISRWNIQYQASMMRQIEALAMRAEAGRISWKLMNLMLGLLAVTIYSGFRAHHFDAVAYSTAFTFALLAREFGANMGARRRLARLRRAS